VPVFGELGRQPVPVQRRLEPDGEGSRHCTSHACTASIAVDRCRISARISPLASRAQAVM
jgi:hypothetical protein